MHRVRHAIKCKRRTSFIPTFVEIVQIHRVLCVWEKLSGQNGFITLNIPSTWLSRLNFLTEINSILSTYKIVHIFRSCAIWEEMTYLQYGQGHLSFLLLQGCLASVFFLHTVLSLIYIHFGYTSTYINTFSIPINNKGNR